MPVAFSTASCWHYSQTPLASQWRLLDQSIRATEATALSQADADLADVRPLQYPPHMLRIMFEGLLPDSEIEELANTCAAPSCASRELQQYRTWPEAHLLPRRDMSAGAMYAVCRPLHWMSQAFANSPGGRPATLVISLPAVRLQTPPLRDSTPATLAIGLIQSDCHR